MTYTLDNTDRQIIALLQRDGRMPNVEIARDLGVAEGTVRKRLERLLGSGFIRIRAIPEPALLSAVTRVFIGVETDLPLIERVAEMLADIPEINSVSVVAGTYDIIVEAILPPDSGLLSFLVGKIAAIPGVIRTETYHVLKTVKWPGDWLIPDDLASRAGKSRPAG